MTVEKEVISQLKGLKNNLFLMNYAPTAKESKEKAISMAIESLRKNMAKKYIKQSISKLLEYSKCPSCDGLLHLNENFCGNCGQAIDWSD